MLRDIVYGTDAESQVIGQIFADWRYHNADGYVFDIHGLVADTLQKLTPIAYRWAGAGQQSEILLLQTKKLLLANNPDRAEKLWRACVGPKAMRHLGGMWTVIKEMWLSKGAN